MSNLVIKVAYGLPSSGKTTLLKQMKGTYYDLDTPDKRSDAVRELLPSLKEGTHILDFFLKEPNLFAEHVKEVLPNAHVHLYETEANRELCVKKDMERDREIKSTELIKNMVLVETKNTSNMYVMRLKTMEKRNIGIEGKTIVKVEDNKEELKFFTDDNEEYIIYHYQDCCEDVNIVREETDDINELVGEVVESVEEYFEYPQMEYESCTKTTYVINTKNKKIKVVWVGTSNGYYSETPSFENKKDKW